MTSLLAPLQCFLASRRLRNVPGLIISSVRVLYAKSECRLCAIVCQQEEEDGDDDEGPRHGRGKQRDKQYRLPSTAEPHLALQSRVRYGTHSLPACLSLGEPYLLKNDE